MRLAVAPLLLMIGCAIDSKTETTPDDSGGSDDLSEYMAGCPTHDGTAKDCMTAIVWSPTATYQFYPVGASTVSQVTTTGHDQINSDGSRTRYVYMWIIKEGTTVDAVYSIPRPSYANVHQTFLDQTEQQNISNIGVLVQEGGGLAGAPKPHTPGGVPWFAVSFVQTVITTANVFHQQWQNVINGTNTKDYQVP